MKYAYVAPALSGCREDSVAEIVLRHHLRAAEGEQDSAVAYALEGFHVESRVAFQRVVQGRPVLGKGRWVEDDEVILVVGRVEKLECIVAEGRVTRVVREVERNVGVGQFDGFRAAVDGVYELCPSTHGVEGESSRVAEHVEYGLVLGVFF